MQIDIYTLRIGRNEYSEIDTLDNVTKYNKRTIHHIVTLYRPLTVLVLRVSLQKLSTLLFAITLTYGRFGWS